MLLFQQSRISCLTNTTAASATQDDEIGVVNDETQPCSSKMSGKKEHKDFRDSIDLELGGRHVPYDLLSCIIHHDDDTKIWCNYFYAQLILFYKMYMSLV